MKQYIFRRSILLHKSSDLGFVELATSEKKSRECETASRKETKPSQWHVNKKYHCTPLCILISCFKSLLVLIEELFNQQTKASRMHSWLESKSLQLTVNRKEREGEKKARKCCTAKLRMQGAPLSCAKTKSGSWIVNLNPFTSHFEMFNWA